MPTDNPKISLYVPQQIYNRFRDFQKDQHLSMSQAGIVILAEYFGLKETIKEITEGTTIGGVTLAEFEKLQAEVKELKGIVNLNKSSGKPPQEKKIINDKIYQTELINESDKGDILINKLLLAKRLKVTNPKSIVNKRYELKRKNKTTAEVEFSKWTQQKDEDGISWKSIQINKKDIRFSPVSELSSELRSKLASWIKENK